MPTSFPPSFRHPREQEVRRSTRSGLPLQQKYRNGGWSSLLVGIVSLCILFGAVTVVVGIRANQVLGRMEQPDLRRPPVSKPPSVKPQISPSTAPAAALKPSKSATATPAPAAAMPVALRYPFNILLIGVDSRDLDAEGVRSDTLIVVHVDPREHWASMLSIPRDSFVTIPHLGSQKINAAYSYGYLNAEELYAQDSDPKAAGGALAAETIEEFLGLKIDYIAQVDFIGFEKIIDTLGGVTVDVTRPLLDPEYPTANFGYERIFIPAGLQVLDGRTALRYARSRHMASDFDRSTRQQRVLRALLKQLQQRKIFDQAALIPKLAESLSSSIATTLPLGDPTILYGLAKLAQELKPERITQFSINPNDVQIVAEEGSNITWNQSDVKLLVNQMLAGPGGEAEVARIQVQNGTGIQFLATKLTNNLANQGFLLNNATDAAEVYPETQIIDYTGRPKTRQRLAKLLGLSAEAVQVASKKGTSPAPYLTDIVVVLGQDYRKEWLAEPTTAKNAPETPAKQR